MANDFIIHQLEDLDLSVRAYNVLRRAGIKTVEQLYSASLLDLLGVRNMGIRCCAEVISKVFNFYAEHHFEHPSRALEVKDLTKTPKPASNLTDYWVTVTCLNTLEVFQKLVKAETPDAAADKFARHLDRLGVDLTECEIKTIARAAI